MLKLSDITSNFRVVALFVIVYLQRDSVLYMIYIFMIYAYLRTKFRMRSSG
jgi:hypothetical protein